MIMSKRQRIGMKPASADGRNEFLDGVYGKFWDDVSAARTPRQIERAVDKLMRKYTDRVTQEVGELNAQQFILHDDTDRMIYAAAFISGRLAVPLKKRY